MSLHRLTRNNPRANGHMGRLLDAHRMVEGQENLMERGNPVVWLKISTPYGLYLEP